jgi:hypothetical protein
MNVGLMSMGIFAEEQEVFSPFFLSSSYKLYLQVILPYLRLQENEIASIQDDPKEFVNYSIDICQQQESRTHKTYAAKLLERLVDNVDGLLTFVININHELIKIILSGQLETSEYAR